VVKDTIIPKSECPHLDQMQILTSDTKQCEVCGINENIRLCTFCGAVHCCESGKGHDTDHFKETGHPIIIPVHAHYKFIWCYKCNAYLK
jgi:uncharacterized UBP type Zn finger protein